MSLLFIVIRHTVAFAQSRGWPDAGGSLNPESQFCDAGVDRAPRWIGQSG